MKTALFLVSGHDTHPVGESPNHGPSTAKCSEPQAAGREAEGEGSAGAKFASLRTET